MTSLFHRRFYPDDVDATVAHVAPLDYPADAVQDPDSRYIRFLEQVGTDPACRQRLKDFQNLALARRAAMQQRMRAEATFTAIPRLGHPRRAAVHRSDAQRRHPRPLTSARDHHHRRHRARRRPPRGRPALLNVAPMVSWFHTCVLATPRSRLMRSSWPSTDA
jgi:hypothetical protein